MVVEVKAVELDDTSDGDALLVSFEVVYQNSHEAALAALFINDGVPVALASDSESSL